MVQTDLKVVIGKIDMLFMEMGNDEVKETLFKLCTFVDNVCEEVNIYPYEELTDWCITYCQIKYSSKHPLNGFFDM